MVVALAVAALAVVGVGGLGVGGLVGAGVGDVVGLLEYLVLASQTTMPSRKAVVPPSVSAVVLTALMALASAWTSKVWA